MFLFFITFRLCDHGLTNQRAYSPAAGRGIPAAAVPSSWSHLSSGDRRRLAGLSKRAEVECPGERVFPAESGNGIFHRWQGIFRFGACTMRSSATSVFCFCGRFDRECFQSPLVACGHQRAGDWFFGGPLSFLGGWSVGGLFWIVGIGAFVAAHRPHRAGRHPDPEPRAAGLRNKLPLAGASSS